MDDGGNGELTILPTYGYQISSTAGGGLLTVTVPSLDGNRTIVLDFGTTLNGEANVTVDLDNNAIVTDFSLRSMSSVSVDTDAGVPFLGILQVEVIEDMQFDVDNPPTAGAIEIVAAGETVTLRVVAGGVELTLAGSDPITLTWDELEELLDNELALAWQRRAALTAAALELVFDLALGLVEALNVIDDSLATNNPLVAACDAFTGAPPPGVLAQGETRFTWLGSGSVPIGGDDFDWAFTDCWIDDVSSTDDQLVNGSISLNTYIEIISADFRLIGSGFDEVIFNNLIIEQTVEDPQGIFSIDPDGTITVNGSFDLAFIEPLG